MPRGASYIEESYLMIGAVAFFLDHALQPSYLTFGPREVIRRLQSQVRPKPAAARCRSPLGGRPVSA
jgi:hypothetical protein